MIKKIILGLVMVSSTSVFAHTAIMSCFDNGDNTITCEGGFSNGSSASGVEFSIMQKDKVILKTRLGEDSDITFDKLNAEYQVVFNAGEGHQIKINGSDITE
jgi:hypothetical protein